MTGAGPCWLPRKRLFQVSAEIHSLFPPSSPSACVAAPQRTVCWHGGSTSYTVAERGGVTYIRERQRGGGARGEERGCPNALTGLPGSDIKPRSNEERAWRRAGRGRGEESSAPWFLRPITTPQTAAFFFFCVLCHSTKDQIGAWCTLEFQRGEGGEFPECFFLFKLKKGVEEMISTCKIIKRKNTSAQRFCSDPQASAKPSDHPRRPPPPTPPPCVFYGGTQ